MQTHTQILIDRWLARPLAILTNYLVRLAGYLVRPKHNLRVPFKTIVLCKFKGMGSIVQATPLLQSLRNQYPSAHIIFVSSEANRGLLNEIGLIDQTILLNDRSFLKLFFSLCAAWWKLIRRRAGLYIDLEIYSDFSSLFAAASMARNRFGFYLRSSSFRMGIYTHMMYFNTRVPVSDAYLQMTSLLGLQHIHRDLYCFPVKQQQPTEAVKPYWIINPNASDLRLERRWPAAAFCELIRKLHEHLPDRDFLFIGSSGERGYVEELTRQLQHMPVYNTAGEWSLSQLIQKIHSAEGMITNDTGPMHLALALKVPVICLFGPCSPVQYHFHDRAFVVYKKLYCSPCVHDFQEAPCKGQNHCMQMIEVEEVFQQVMNLLRGEKTEYTPHPVYYTNALQEAVGWVHRSGIAGPREHSTS